jgi:DNA ligase-1
MNITSTKIFKADSNGGIRTWQYEVDGPKWRTIAGGVGRKSVTSGWTTSVGKQGRSDDEQAMNEAGSAYHQKLDREYRVTEAELPSVPKSPMLAHKYEDHKGKLTFPVFCQPKLDGIRATISAHGAFSREYQRHLNVDHILEALAPAFDKYPGMSFDGELYNHDLREDFGKIASVVRKQNPTPTQRDEARALIQYHVYDLGDDQLPFADRAQLMLELELEGCDVTSKVIQWVPTHICPTSEALDAVYGDYLQAGYEGQMVRTNSLYEFDKRSKALLKRKEFITAEFKLLRIEEGNGNWANMAKRVTFILPDGRECGAGIRGTQAQMKELLTAPWFGTKSLVTIRHFTPTPDGMPRFPVAVDFHFGGRKD